ncbi:MAG: hypothetical protein V7L00_30950 [Nostoc sp.]
MSPKEREIPAIAFTGNPEGSCVCISKSLCEAVSNRNSKTA